MKGGIKKLGQSTVARYILRRLLALIPVLLGVTFITYGLMYISPKDPVEMMLQASGTAPSQEVVDAMRHQLGLDRPFLVQVSYQFGEEHLLFLRHKPYCF